MTAMRQTIVPSGNALRNTFLTNGPATMSWNGRAIMKFLGMFMSQMIGRELKSPTFIQPSSAPYRDMIITMGMTIEHDTAMTFFITGLSGFTRKRNANPFAGPEIMNQSMHMAKI